jgi:hypothetical protein
MKIFPYFDTWDDDAVRECCVLSKIKRYEPDQIILGNNTVTILHTTYVLRSVILKSGTASLGDYTMSGTIYQQNRSLNTAAKV